MNKHEGVLDVKYHLERKKRGSAPEYRLRRRTDEVLKAIKTFQNNNVYSILDVGTGDGLMLDLINEQVNTPEPVGLDLSLELLKKTDPKSKSRFVHGDVLDMPFENETFDTVIAAAVIEHVSNADVFISGCKRVLKKGGILIITTPDPFFEKLATKMGHLKGEHHNKTFNLSELKTLLKVHNLEILIAEKFMMSPIGFPSEILWDKLEQIMKKIGLEFLMLNQIVVGKKFIKNKT